MRLAAAGVASPRADAELLAGHVLAASRGEVAARALRGQHLSAEHAAALAALVARREQREPLQHLTGTAPFRRLTLAVGPGVFVPRPETEVTAGLAVAEAAALADAGHEPVVVDLCTGSGAIALSVAAEVPAARVVAVEVDDAALVWARRNLAGRPRGEAQRVALVRADVRDALTCADLGLDGPADIVVANPPYVPPGAVPREVEVREHDPALALYGGGDDGLDLPRAVVAAAARLLGAGGLVVVEHAEGQSAALRSTLAPPGWAQATTHADLRGAPRCTSARRVR